MTRFVLLLALLAAPAGAQQLGGNPAVAVSLKEACANQPYATATIGIPRTFTFSITWQGQPQPIRWALKQTSIIVIDTVTHHPKVVPYAVIDSITGVFVALRPGLNVVQAQAVINGHAMRMVACLQQTVRPSA